MVIGKERLDKEGFLSLSGIWKDKSEEEIDFYREIIRDRERFGRGEIEL